MIVLLYLFSPTAWAVLLFREAWLKIRRERER